VRGGRGRRAFSLFLREGKKEKGVFSFISSKGGGERSPRGGFWGRRKRGKRGIIILLERKERKKKDTPPLLVGREIIGRDAEYTLKVEGEKGGESFSSS